MFEFKDKRYRNDFYTTNKDYPNQDVIVQYPELDKYQNTELNIYTKRRIGLTKNELSSYKILSNIEHTKFSNLFFSNANIQILQNELRYRVYMRSSQRHIIEEQNIAELGEVMEHMYLNYSSNPREECLFKKEIERLNELVLNYCVPRVISSIEMQSAYIKRITTERIPLGGGEYTSKKGTYIVKQINPGF